MDQPGPEEYARNSHLFGILLVPVNIFKHCSYYSDCRQGPRVLSTRQWNSKEHKPYRIEARAWTWL